MGNKKEAAQTLGTFDYSGAMTLPRNGGACSRAKKSRILFGQKKKNGRNDIKTAKVILSKADNEKIVGRYGREVCLCYMPVERLLVIAGSRPNRTVSRSSSGTSIISIDALADRLVEDFGKHQLVYLRLCEYENCFVLAPTGEVE